MTAYTLNQIFGFFLITMCVSLVLMMWGYGSTNKKLYERLFDFSYLFLGASTALACLWIAYRSDPYIVSLLQ